MKGIPASLAAVALLAVAASGIPSSDASFTASRTNPGNSFSAAASFCSTPGTQTVKANADAYVNEEAPATNSGNATTLNIRSRSSKRNRRSLVSFALPSIPAGCSVTAATLRLWQTSGTVGRTIQAYAAGGAWSEGTVTWTNQPTTSGAAATSASAIDTNWRTWTVTSQVATMYSPGPAYGFLLRDASESAPVAGIEQVYQSREGTGTIQDPELVITFG